MPIPKQLSVALCAALCATVAQAAPVWITLGDPAFRQLQHLDPGAAAQYSQPLAAGRSPDGAARRETVHIVQIDDALLGDLSQAVHRARGHGPGFIVHDSYEDARQALLPPVLSKQAAAPDYAIANSQQIKTWLTQLQASNIVGTITSLTGFTNRYYTTSHGVAASDWITLQWKQLGGARTDVTVEQFTHAGWPQKSVILTIKGSDPAAGTVVLGGHIDSTIGRTTARTRARPAPTTTRPGSRASPKRCA